MKCKKLGELWLAAILWIGCWNALPGGRGGPTQAQAETQAQSHTRTQAQTQTPTQTATPTPTQTATATATPTQVMASQARPAVLTTVSQVQALSQEEAAKHVPVKLRGVVTAFSGWKDFYFLQDATGAIAINREEDVEVHRGDEIELEGTSDPGLFRNSVISKSARVLGRGAMPQVPTSTFADLEGGNKDAEWVRVQGIVRSAKIEHIWDKRVLVLSMDLGGGVIDARIPNFSETDALYLVDAVVDVEGVCGTVFNDKREYSGLRLFVPALSEVHVKEPAAANPFNMHASTVRSLLQFLPSGRGRHRVKIAGIVTYQQDGRSLYLQDGKDGILLSLVEQKSIPIGSHIEALGFVGLNGYSPTLNSAEVRITNATGSVEPASIRGPDFVKNHNNTFLFAPYEGQLVRVQGEVISPLALPNEDAWLLQDGDTQFVASLRRKPNGKALKEIRNGSVVSLTGVMSVTEDSDGQPLSFRVLIRTPQDVTLLSRAPWWSPVRLATALVVLLAATLTVVLWTVSLKRKVQQQTSKLRDSERRLRALAEHDPLTGMGNRASLHDELAAAIQKAKRTGSPFGVVMLDLDHFKEVNDTWGHHAGDQLLCAMAGRIRSTVRRSDVVARMGGDEFVVLLTSTAKEEDAVAVGAKLVANLATPASIGMAQMTVSTSVGVCTYPSGGATEEILLQHADEAMYRAKAKGGNSFCVYDAGLDGVRKPTFG